MADLRPRLECPVCLGTRMERTRFRDKPRLDLDHCPRCGGVWFDDGEVQKLRGIAAHTFWSRVARPGPEPAMACRGCTATLGRRDERCAGCGWKNALDCPACGAAMRREAHGGAVVEVCRPCRSVWFDHAELGAIWRAGAATLAAAAVAPAPAEHRDGGWWLDVGLDPGAIEATARLGAAGVDASAAVARAATEAAANLPDAAAGAFEAAAGAAEVLGAVAEGAFELVCGILKLVFGVLEGL